MFSSTRLVTFACLALALTADATPVPKFTFSGAQVGSGLTLKSPGAFGTAESYGTAGTTKADAHIYGSTFANGDSSSTKNKVENSMSTGSTVTINKREPKKSIAKVGSGLQLDTPGASGFSESGASAATTKDSAHIYGTTFANGYSSSTKNKVENGMGTGSTIVINKRDEEEKREPKKSVAKVGSGLELDTPGAFGFSASGANAATTKDNAHIYGTTYANGYSSSTKNKIENGMGTGATIEINKQDAEVKREPKKSIAKVGSGLELDTPGAFGLATSVGKVTTTKDDAHIYGTTFANGDSSSTAKKIQNSMSTGSTVTVN